MSVFKPKSCFISESRNYVHVGLMWEEAKRYAYHRLKLEQKLASEEDDIEDGNLPIILKCDAYQKTFSRDNHDQGGLRTIHNFDVDSLFVLVIPKECEDDTKSLWLPIYPS